MVVRVEDRVLIGIGWMVVGTVLFTIMNALVRQLSAELPPFEIAFFRNLASLLCILPWIAWRGARSLRTQRQSLYLTRALVNLVSMLSWFWALSVLPLAQAVALNFTNPMFTTIGAALFLGEIVRARRWTATLVGFLGVLVIVRPGAEGLDWGSMIALLSAAFGAISGLQVKVLARSERSDVIVTYMVLWLTPLSLPPALLVWQTPSMEQLAWLGLIGMIGTLAHLAATEAFHHADASLLVPYNYLKMPFAAVLAYLMFGETVDHWTILGATIICGSSLYIARRETAAATLAREIARAER
jgi:drug/metabolite transporter (DMT)-like permease